MTEDLGKIGPYELRGELGHGAMARVWRAWDPNLEREVAIKEPLFDPRLPQSAIDEMGRRFVSEGRTAARLNHPGIVTIHAADVYDGRPAIVMELIDGETLSARLRRGPLSSVETLAVIDQLLNAVGYAHARGVVHRDIKPDNIFIDSTGRVKLADFGIARVDGALTLGTVEGAVLGTPGDMSPEQATGAMVDARSDLFSVGVVGYEMLTGVNPFGVGSVTDANTLIYRIVNEQAPAIPDSAVYGYTVDMRPAIMSALSKDPNARPQSAAEFSQMIYRVPAPSGTYTQPIDTDASKRDVTGKDDRFKKWLPYLIAASIGLLALVFLVVTATSGATGGGSTGSAPAQTTSENVSNATNESSDASEGGNESKAYYLAVSAGYVAIYAEGEADPIQVTDISISDLSTESVNGLTQHVECASFDSAQTLLSVYRSEAEARKSGDQSESGSNSQSEESSSVTASPSEQFPREWRGTFGGTDDKGVVSDHGIAIEFTQVGDNGSLYGICTVGAGDSDVTHGAGSYHVEGSIDWYTGEVNLYGRDWINKGSLGVMRNYSGTISGSFSQINGTCVSKNGGSESYWYMSAL